MEPIPPTVRPGLSRRFYVRLFTWGNARRLLLSVAVLSTLIALFYAEENWRGRRAWEAFKVQFETTGVDLDWSSYLPKPVPDDQNIFKAANMQGWFVKGATDPTNLSHRLNNTNYSHVPELISELSPQQANEFLAWNDQFLPEFNQMREALKRPAARIDGNYDMPFDIPVPNFVILRTMAQTLAKRTQCYLVLGKPEQALAEVTLMHNLSRILDCRFTGRPVTLVAAMINVAIHGLATEVIADGLQLHAWRESDLATLQGQLKETILPLTVAEAFNCEPIASCRTLEVYPRMQLLRLVNGSSFWRSNDKLAYLFIKYGPRGWFYQNMMTMAALMNRGAGIWNATSDRIDTAKAIAWPKEFERIPLGPYTFMSRIAIPNYTKAWMSTAYNQTSVNLALISCALERYHQAQGQYPVSLDALTPQYLDKIPHDLIGGESLQYHRTDDGNFALYSIGWNQTDDGGQIVRAGRGSPAAEKGDWLLTGVPR